ncbi:MAG: DUF1080 domain-containing protein, partial [Verrucomicrobiota bacterium]
HRMKSLFKIILGCFALLLTATAFSAEKIAPTNQLSAKEKKAGWKLLFDGKSLAGWRNYRKPNAPEKGWVVQDGTLKLEAKSHPGDIITLEKFSDYDLQWDWKIPANANNGIKYLVIEERGNTPGPEYQMLDDAVEEAPKNQTASLYDILPPTKLKLQKPIGEWNHSRVLVQGNHVEHWLNGTKVLEYELGSPELKAAIAQSKFKAVKDFGEKVKGHILLTDHSDEASYRNIKILELPAK